MLFSNSALLSKQRNHKIIKDLAMVISGARKIGKEEQVRCQYFASVRFFIMPGQNYQVFLRGLSGYVKKADLSKGYHNPTPPLPKKKKKRKKRKEKKEIRGIFRDNCHELQFGKKMSCIVLHLKPFLELPLLNYLRKMPHG